MGKFDDKIERLRNQQMRYDEVISKRHPSDVHCPNCDTFITRLKKENGNKRKSIKTNCPNFECGGHLKIIYNTNSTKFARVFAIEFNK